MTTRGLFTVPSLIFTLIAAAPASVPGQIAQAAQTVQTAPPAPRSTGVDASRLPVNLDRIARQIKTAPGTEGLPGLRLEYRLVVFGNAPAIRAFLPGESQTTGPVRDSAPAHRDFINFWSSWRTGRR